MTIWAIFATMTGAAVMAVLWPLSRHRAARPADDADQAFYKDQIAEIARDHERDLIGAAEAVAAKAEAGRRLLRTKTAQEARLGDAVGEPALRRRRAASAIALSMVPLVAIAVYGAVGSPQIPAAPLAARMSPEAREDDVAALVHRVEVHLAKNPEDGRGWEILAPVYLKLGRFEDAGRAGASAMRLLGRSVARLETYGEALVAARDGVVPAEARAVFDEVLALDAARPKARYYLAQAAEQDGDRDTAQKHYLELIARAPQDASWLAFVRQRLALLTPSVPVETVATPLAGGQSEAIRGMVEGLAQRLDTGGGSPEEWARLMRSYVVLGEQGKAKATFDKARRQVETGQIASLEATARELGLDAEGGRR